MLIKPSENVLKKTFVSTLVYLNSVPSVFVVVSDILMRHHQHRILRFKMAPFRPSLRRLHEKKLVFPITRMFNFRQNMRQVD